MKNQHVAFKLLPCSSISTHNIVLYFIQKLPLKIFLYVLFCECVGGIQIIGAGSFKQLPPIPSFTDPGRFCFQSPIFDSVFPHHMVLDEVVRQCEKDLIKAINEFCDGNLSQDTLKLVEELKRPPSC